MKIIHLIGSSCIPRCYVILQVTNIKKNGVFWVVTPWKPQILQQILKSLNRGPLSKTSNRNLHICYRIYCIYFLKNWYSFSKCSSRNLNIYCRIASTFLKTDPVFRNDLTALYILNTRLLYFDKIISNFIQTSTFTVQCRFIDDGRWGSKRWGPFGVNKKRSIGRVYTA
jgi:hypothetical protein